MKTLREFTKEELSAFIAENQKRYEAIREQGLSIDMSRGKPSPVQLDMAFEDFKKAFELSLVFYKGVKIADPELTLASLNNKTSKTVNTHADGLKIKASMKVGDAERLFDTNFGVTVQIKDKEGKKLVPNEITIGQAARGEY